KAGRHSPKWKPRRETTPSWTRKAIRLWPPSSPASPVRALLTYESPKPPRRERTRPTFRRNRRRMTTTISDGGNDEGPSRPDGQGEGDAGEIPDHAGR